MSYIFLGLKAQSYFQIPHMLGIKALILVLPFLGRCSLLPWTLMSFGPAILELRWLEQKLGWYLQQTFTYYLSKKMTSNQNRPPLANGKSYAI